METAVELSRHIVEIFATEEELNIINQSKLFKQERMYSELFIYLQQKADEDRLKSLTSNQIRAMIEQFKNK